MKSSCLYRMLSKTNEAVELCDEGCSAALPFKLGGWFFSRLLTVLLGSDSGEKVLNQRWP